MIPKECKRIVKVNFAIAVAAKHAARTACEAMFREVTRDP